VGVRDRLYWSRYERQYEVRRVRRVLEEFASSSPEAAREHLALRLRDTLRAFAGRDDALPEWREAARVDDLDALWRLWPSLPIVTKADLRGRFSASRLRERGVEGVTSSTGGSTGEPTAFIHDPAAVRTIGALQYLSRRAVGWRPGQPTICVWGAQRDIGQGLTGYTRWRHALTNRLARLHEVDGYALTDETARRVYDALRRSGGRAAIYGFSSMLDHVAAVVEDKGWEVPRGLVDVAWNGGEMLLDTQIERFRRVFGVPILNYYGGREVGTVAAQRVADGPLHLVRPFLFVELVDDQGAPVPAGTPGRLLVTSTENRGTPFIRYDIGDLATCSAEGIDASGVTRLDALVGRTASILQLPNGARVSNLYWNHLFKEVEEITQFQVRLRADGSLRFHFVGRPFAPEREAWLRGVLERFLGPIPVDIVWVDTIAPTRLGKRLQVVVEEREPAFSAFG
jgi:phenylacetate-CoA ligase